MVFGVRSDFIAHLIVISSNRGLYICLLETCESNRSILLISAIISAVYTEPIPGMLLKHLALGIVSRMDIMPFSSSLICV